MCGSLSGGTPGPSSLTSMATRPPTLVAVIVPVVPPVVCTSTFISREQHHRDRAGRDDGLDLADGLGHLVQAGPGDQGPPGDTQRLDPDQVRPAGTDYGVRARLGRDPGDIEGHAAVVRLHDQERLHLPAAAER